MDYEEEFYAEEGVTSKWLESVKLMGHKADLTDCLKEGFKGYLLVLAIEELESQNPRTKVKTK